MIVEKVTYLDNPYNSDRTLKQAERAKEKDPESYKHIWLGECKGTGSKFYGVNRMYTSNLMNVILNCLTSSIYQNTRNCLWLSIRIQSITLQLCGLHGLCWAKKCTT